MVGSVISHSHGGESSRTMSDLGSSGDVDKFACAVAKTAVAQICESTGFHSIQLSALETLTDITIHYLCDVGKRAHSYANSAGRTQSNALDTVAALEDISGASFSDPQCPASSSVCVKELIRFVDYGDEMPFAKPLPHFPVCKSCTASPSFWQADETPPSLHIPSWLPAFPDPSTYMASSARNDSNQDAHLDLDDGVQRKQRHKADRSLVSFHLRLCTSGALTCGDITTSCTNNITAAMGASSPPASRSLPSEHHLDADKLDADGLHSKGKRSKRPAVCAQNPFLAPLLPPGAKEVPSLLFNSTRSPSPVPSKKKICAPAFPSILDVFRPALEVAGYGAQESSGRSLQSTGGLLPVSKGRMPVSMRLDYGKRIKGKAAVTVLEVGVNNRKRGYTLFTDDDQDEKKKRAEQILAQGLEGD